MSLRVLIVGLMMAAFLAAPMVASASPVASKDGATYSMDDLSLYWLRNLGKDGLLDFLQTMVVYQEGLKQGLAPTQGDINDFVDDTMGRDIYNEFVQLFDETAVRQLVEYTLVTSDYELWLRDKVRRDRNITVTEDEARSFFLETIDEFHLPEGVWLSIISVVNRVQGDEVLRRLGNGEDFNDIAGEVNMDAQMRAARGELGIYRRGDGLPEPLEEAAFNLREGQYSNIIQGTNFHIVMCHKRYAEISPTFEEVKEDLMLDLVEAKIDPYYLDELNVLMASEMPRFTILAELFKPDTE
jgi:parvulin-like peptidyl-prolyl isomerase